MLLRVVARFRRGGRIGSYVVRWAWSPTIRASFQAAAAEQQCFIGTHVRRHHEPHLGAVSVCVEGTAPTGGWIRRRRRRATECRQAGKRRVELSLNENICFSDQHRKLRGAFCFLGRGRRGTDWNRVSTRASAKERAE